MDEDDGMSTGTLVGIICGVLGTILLCMLCKCWFDGGKCKSYQDLAGKVIIITGANAGIGLATAMELANLGYGDGNSKIEPKTIVIACRNQTRALAAIGSIQQKLGAGNITNLEFIQLDLGDLNSVKKFAQQIKQKYEKVDMLINNAGIFAAEKDFTVQGYEKMFGINHLGHFLLTQLLLDQIKASHQGRIINVSSDAHRAVKGEIDLDDLTQVKEFVGFKRYGLSKLCNILFTRQLDLELKKQNITNVKVCSLHPGAVRTDIGFDYFNDKPIKKCLFYCICGPLCCPFYYLCFKNAKQGAQTTLQCSLINFEHLQSGLYYKDCAVQKELLNENWQTQAQQLWDKSEELVKEFK